MATSEVTCESVTHRLTVVYASQSPQDPCQIVGRWYWQRFVQKVDSNIMWASWLLMIPTGNWANHVTRLVLCFWHAAWCLKTVPLIVHCSRAIKSYSSLRFLYFLFKGSNRRRPLFCGELTFQKSWLTWQFLVRSERNDIGGWCDVATSSETGLCCYVCCLKSCLCKNR